MNLLELTTYNMTTKETEIILEAIEKLRESLENSFDRFIEEIKSPEQRQLEVELKEEANRLTIHND